MTRALSELATEGVVIRHRRRGTFVNPHWLHGRRGGPELRVIVPEGPWEGLIRRAAPADTRLSVATVELHELHQALTHAVAEGLGPDLAVLDSVWVPEFTAAGFLAPLEELWYTATRLRPHAGELGLAARALAEAADTARRDPGPLRLPGPVRRPVGVRDRRPVARPPLVRLAGRDPGCPRPRRLDHRLGRGLRRIAAGGV